MSRVSGIALLVLWAVLTEGILALVVDDFGRGPEAGISASIVLMATVLGGPPVVLASWWHHRRYETRWLLPAIGATAALVVVVHFLEPLDWFRPGEPPALHQACRDDDVERARALLNDGASVGELFGYDTPLSIAMESGSGELVALLIEHGADVSDRDLWLPMAARNPDVRVMEQMLDGVDASHSIAAAIALETAICLPNRPVARLLIQRGAQTDFERIAPDAVVVAAGCGQTWVAEEVESDTESLDHALRIVAEHENAEGVLDLLRAGADPNAREVGGQGPSALGLAIERGQTDMIGPLVERGGKLNEDTATRDRRVGWPLSLAIEQRDPEMVEALLELGAGLPDRDVQADVAARGASTVARELIAAE